MKRRNPILYLILVLILSFELLAQQNDESKWYVSHRDLSIVLRETVEKEGSHPIEIVRKYDSAFEEGLLSKAEAVYSRKTKGTGLFPPMVTEAEQDLLEPLWWEGKFDDVRIASVVSTSAVQYYYNISQGLRGDPRFIPNYAMSRTSLRYVGSIRYRSEYTHGKDDYRGVYIAVLELEWSQYCGGLCGMSFKRKKEVVLDANGNVLALYLEAPENSRLTVS